MRALSLLIATFLGVALVLALVVGSTMYFVRPVVRVGPGAVAVAPVPALPAEANAPIAAMNAAQQVTASEFALTPNRIEVVAGAPFKLTLVNKGAIQHDLTVSGTSVKLVADAGKSAEGTFTIGQPGSYAMLCSIPGHAEAGMQGTLVVTGGGQATAAQPAAQATQQPLARDMAQAQPTADVHPMPDGLQLLPQPQMAPPITRTAPALVKVELETKEVVAKLADGVAFTYWTFNGTVPGPMLRVREGDTVDVTLKNSLDSKVTHSIDFHAVTGPGGGAKVMQVPPGGQASFRFQALNPGVYVYHCATPMVSHHIASGMYGLIVVEPKEGLPKVDHEYYLMQGDFYLQGERGQQGLRAFAMDKMLDERPDYVLFNGGAGSLLGERALKARVGETVRIFFGVGGPNLSSSFHVIGEIFDRVHPEGASEVLHNVQTTTVAPGGATLVEFTTQVPGTYTLVDHSLGRLEKGAAGQLVVDGPDNPDVFQPLPRGTGGGQ